MLGNLGNLGALMKKAQEAQARAAQIQEELATLEIRGEAGGGLVVCSFSGTKEVLDVQIDGAKLGLDAEDSERLQDAVRAAAQAALAEVDRRAAAAMDEITEGLPIPKGLL